MSEFSCPVVRISIETHPNADAIEIARVGDYQSIVKKGEIADGHLAVYIPEQAVLPEWLLRQMGFWDDTKGKGMLSGTLGNRVRAIKLRGVLSQGLVLRLSEGNVLTYPPRADGACGHQCQEGENVADLLDITKYEPPLPSHMAGKVVGIDLAATLKYDFENLKKYPDLFITGEPVVITEKIHGTFIQVGVVPSSMANERYYKGRVIVSSKGLGGKGFVLDHTDETNLYIQAAKRHNLLDSVLEYFGSSADEHEVPYFVCGEVFGTTPTGAVVQDLTYGYAELAFRLFDVCAGTRGQEEFFPFELMVEAANNLHVSVAPVLYVGPYSKEKVLELTDGNTAVQPFSRRSAVRQIREGVVVKSSVEARHPKYGRKIAKSVSEAYLLRKNATEFN